MAFMPWTDAFLTGFRIIDIQHRWLVDATNRWYDEASQPEPDPQVIGEVLDGLMDYADNHFRVENGMLNRPGYPGSEGHIAEHANFAVQAA